MKTILWIALAIVLIIGVYEGVAIFVTWFLEEISWKLFWIWGM